MPKDKKKQITIDDILGPDMSETVPDEENTVQLGLITNIDYILNNGLVKFDNKYQTSMYFVCYKALHSLCNDLKAKYNIQIPKTFLDNHLTATIPKTIKDYTGNLKKRCKKPINTEMICMGRKLDNKQCTRKKHNGSDFCKSHLVKLSNGRVDQPTNIAIRNKRGRKRKVEFDPRQYDVEYITLWEDIVDGQKVLIDGNNNIYTYDIESPRYLGKKQIGTKLEKIVEEKKTIQPTLDSILGSTLDIQNTPKNSTLIAAPIPESKIELEDIKTIKPIKTEEEKVINKKITKYSKSKSKSKSKTKGQ